MRTPLLQTLDQNGAFKGHGLLTLHCNGVLVVSVSANAQLPVLVGPHRVNVALPSSEQSVVVATSNLVHLDAVELDGVGNRKHFSQFCVGPKA